MFRSEKSINLIKLIYKERILTKTDGPFVQISNNYIYPWDVNKTITQLTELWKFPINDSRIQLKNLLNG